GLPRRVIGGCTDGSAPITSPPCEGQALFRGKPHCWSERQPSSLLAALPCFPRGCFASSGCLLNGKVFELRTSLELLSQPAGLRASACPGVTLLVAIFGGHLPTLHRASSAAPATACFAPKL